MKEKKKRAETDHTLMEKTKDLAMVKLEKSPSVDNVF